MNHMSQIYNNAAHDGYFFSLIFHIFNYIKIKMGLKNLQMVK